MSATNPRAEWEHIASQLPRLQSADLPFVPPKVTPLVNTPECPAHCTSHHVDRTVCCPSCGAECYEVWMHQWPWSEGHYWSEARGKNGAPPYTKECPNCQGGL